MRGASLGRPSVRISGIPKLGKGKKLGTKRASGRRSRKRAVAAY